MLLRAGIYLDSNAGAPLRPRVQEALLAFFRESHHTHPFPNPSSLHSYGRHAKKLLAQARLQIAQSLGSSIDPADLIFTSSGTESNQLAIRSVLEHRLLQGEKPHWITSSVEHDSVLQCVEWLKAHGGSVSFLPVDSHGIYDFSAISSLWRKETALVSLLWVNNETGVINPIQTAAHRVKSQGGIFHVDATQAWGKLPVDLNSLGADWVSFAGHKIGAPAGIGVLWKKENSRNNSFVPLLMGKQEKSRRGGTENLLGAILLGIAASDLNPLEWTHRVAPLRDRLQDAIFEKIPDVTIHGQLAPRVANTLCLSFGAGESRKVQNDTLVAALDLAGFAVSQGSACSSGVAHASPVLLAMGVSESDARSAIRISLVDEVPWSQLERFVDELGRIVNLQRKEPKTLLTRS